MVNISENPCSPVLVKTPELRALTACEGVEVSDVLFLASLIPCCAQLALPYWAKVSGTLANILPEEQMIRVTVTLFGSGNNILGQYTDMFFVEPGESVAFDVKLLDHQDKTTAYSVDITAEEQV